MATPTAIYQTYNQVGIREDLSDVIYDISPMDTIFFTKAAREKATNTLTDWQIDSLAAASSGNAFIEGDDFSGQAISATTKLRNYCQISRKDLVTSRTANKVNTAGRKREHAYQVMKKGKELKRDIEKIALHDKAATAGSSASPRVTAGVESWLHTDSHIKAASQTTSTTVAPSGGIPLTAPTDGSSTALTEALFKSALQQSWSAGGEADLVLLPAGLKNTVDGFTGIATRFRDVASGQQAEIIGAADLYVSSYGTHKLVLSRYMKSTSILFMDMNYWGLAWLDPIHTEAIAKSGDSEKTMLVGEWAVVCKNPGASTKLTSMA